MASLLHSTPSMLSTGGWVRHMCQPLYDQRNHNSSYFNIFHKRLNLVLFVSCTCLSVVFVFEAEQFVGVCVRSCTFFILITLTRKY